MDRDSDKFIRRAYKRINEAKARARPGKAMYMFTHCMPVMKF